MTGANNKRKRILVAVNNDLVVDARVHRVCSSLLDFGYSVWAIGRRRKGVSAVETHRAYPIRRLRMMIHKSILSYAEFNIRLLLNLLFTHADAILCNDTDALPACYMASKLKRIPIIFDAHELFPELPEVVGRPAVQRFWRGLEDMLFPKLRYCYTVCQSIADYYNERYGLQMQVVRNIPMAGVKSVCSPRVVEQIRQHKQQGRQILLYQGAVNVGRGIDWIINAMPLLPDCVLYICGDGEEMNEMQLLARRTGCADRIVFAGRIPQEQLYSITCEAHLGFVLLEHLGMSYYYALPNRIFDYLQAGVPVLATDFPEIRRMVSEAQSGTLISHYEPTYLAQQITAILQEWSPEARAALTLRAARYTWAQEVEGLRNIVQSCMAAN